MRRVTGQKEGGDGVDRVEDVLMFCLIIPPIIFSFCRKVFLKVSYIYFITMFLLLIFVFRTVNFPIIPLSCLKRAGAKTIKKDTNSTQNKSQPRAKTINVFRACLGAQLTICAQK